MKDVLIGSVFANDLGLQPKWLDIQLRFIQETTKSYDHIAVVSEGLTTDEFLFKTNTIVPQNTLLTWSDAHLQGLNLLLDYFKSNSKHYSYFLFLDSDAFPINKNWLNGLKSVLDPQSPTGMILPNKKDIAVAVRAENLESRLHASILFAKREALQNLHFVFGSAPMQDLMGRSESDIYLSTYENNRNLAFPLIRSNQFNVDPVACGIYYDMFYHHACGSREFKTRSDSYWSKIISHERDFTQKLIANPVEFVGKLAGWNSKLYLQ